ncbi:MAG: hypothetical protein J6P16_00890 [Eubacterium sp.]|nr:hypothetical protein [Eubacterium sp.]
MRKITKIAAISAMCLSLVLLSPVIKIKAAQGVDATGIDVSGLEGATDIVYMGDSLEGVNEIGAEPISGIYFSSDKDSLPLANNGATPVLDDERKLVRFNYGDDSGYIMYIYKNSWKPYISDIKIVKAGSKEEAAETLLGEGCSYYIDKNYSDAGGYLMIGYMRTDDESEAITDIIGFKGSGDGADDPGAADIMGYDKVSDEKIAGHTLYVSRESAIGNPVCDLDAFGEASGITVTPKMLAGLRLSRGDAKAKQYIIADDGYKSFVDSDEEYIIDGVKTSDGMDIGISLASKKDGLNEKNIQKKELLDTYFNVSSGGGEAAAEGEEAVVAESEEAAATEEEAESVAGTDSEEYAEDIINIGGENTEDTSDEQTTYIAGETEFDTLTDETYENAPMTSDGTEENADDTEGTEGTILSILGGTGASVFFVVILGIAVVIPIAAVIVNKKLRKDKMEG